MNQYSKIYRGHKINIDKDAAGWNIQITTPGGNGIYSGGWFNRVQAQRVARRRIDEVIRNRRV